MAPERRRTLFAIGTVAVAWFAAFAVEVLARVTHRAYAPFGADLPEATLLSFSAVQNYVPWIAVAAATLIIAWLGMRKSAYLGHACAALALATALGASLVAFSIGLPGMRMCGGLGLPEWHVAQAPAASGSCGR
jgi:hypothetical protein